MRLRLAAAALSAGLAFGTFAPAMPVYAEHVTEDGINVREKPTTSSGVIGLLYEKDDFDVTGEKTDKDGNVWCQIKIGSKTGYVRADFVKGYVTQAEKKAAEEKKKEEEAKKKAE
ncbi:MAG: SH3 domain-containing protein, partial [Lachnospiraceae bacterium]|nr:SH3 domain-containing protein [Lachnospiraceae bacterium]